MATENNQEFFYSMGIEPDTGRIYKRSKVGITDRVFKVYKEGDAWFITYYPGIYGGMFGNNAWTDFKNVSSHNLCPVERPDEHTQRAWNNEAHGYSGVVVVKPGRVVQKDGNFYTDPENPLEVILCPNAERADEYLKQNAQRYSITYNDYLVAKNAERAEAEVAQPQSVQHPVEQQPEQVVVEPGSVIEFDVDGHGAQVVGTADDQHKTDNGSADPDEIVFQPAQGEVVASEVVSEVIAEEQNSDKPKKKKITWADIAEKLRGRKHKKQNPDASVPEAESVGGTVESEDFVGAGGPSVDFETTDFESADEESGNSKNKPGFVARLREKGKQIKAKRKNKKSKKSTQEIVDEEGLEVPVFEPEPVDPDPVVINVDPENPTAEQNDNDVRPDDNVQPGDVDPVIVNTDPVEEDGESEDTIDKKSKGKTVAIAVAAAALLAAGVWFFGGKRGGGNSNGDVTPVVPVDTIPAPVPVDTVPVVDTNNVQPVVHPNKPPKLVRRDPTIWQPGDPKPAHIKRRAIYNGR